jgi:hypothetical protein
LKPDGKKLKACLMSLNSDYALYFPELRRDQTLETSRFDAAMNQLGTLLKQSDYATDKTTIRRSHGIS